MFRGDRVGGRFEIEHEAAKGGMGTVYRAYDRVTRVPVALKILSAAEVTSSARFERESQVLSKLSDPAIVRYVAHGVEAGGEHYLAMEWVEGETLLARLEHTGLDAAETMVMARTIAGALTLTHGHGVIHRDIKPSNLIFADGRVDRVKLIDFGIARRRDDPQSLTTTGMMVGTLGYMAPEQARASARVPQDPSTDVFSLGCVLYECLTGRPAFSGENLLAVRAKILLVDPPDVRETVPELPEELAALVRRMLAKVAAKRPADGAALAAELLALPSMPATPRRRLGAGVPAPATVVGESGDRMACVLLVAPGEPDADAYAETFRAAVEPFGAQIHALAGGGMVVTVSPDGSLAHQVDRVARLALAVRDLCPAGSLALASAADTAPDHPLELLLDRGAQVLERASVHAAYDELVGTTGESAVWIDEHTARLLAGRFDVRPVKGAGFRLVREK